VTPPAAGYSYQLGATGNRTSASEVNGRTLNWSYDGIYLLTNETIGSDPSHNNGSVGYGLDPVGNRLSASSTIPGVGSGMATRVIVSPCVRKRTLSVAAKKDPECDAKRRL
jgi:hypothetical protein